MDTDTIIELEKLTAHLAPSMLVTGTSPEALISATGKALAGFPGRYRQQLRSRLAAALATYLALFSPPVPAVATEAGPGLVLWSGLAGQLVDVICLGTDPESKVMGARRAAAELRIGWVRVAAPEVPLRSLMGPLGGDLGAGSGPSARWPGGWA